MPERVCVAKITCKWPFSLHRLDSELRNEWFMAFIHKESKRILFPGKKILRDGDTCKYASISNDLHKECAPETRRVIHIPQESHLFIFLLVIADDLGGGHTHLHAVNNKLPGSLQSLTGEVLRGREKQTIAQDKYCCLLFILTCFTKLWVFKITSRQRLSELLVMK